MNKLLLFSVILASLGLSLIAVPEASAQAPAPGQNAASLEVIARNGADEEKHRFSQDGVVPPFVIRPNQTVPVALQFPTAMAGTSVSATPLDGGRISGGNGLVLPTGKVIFTFNPGAGAGRYRVLVQTPLEQHLLEFYVVDPNHDPRQQRPGGGH